MRKYDLDTIREESEELTGMLSVMAIALGDDGEDEMYRTIRAAFKKAKALEYQIAQLNNK